MKVITLIILIILLVTCNYNDDSIMYEHNSVNNKIHIIDENNIYYDDIYFMDNFLKENDCKEVKFYEKETNKLVTSYIIYDYDWSNPDFIIDEYYFYVKYVDDYIEYQYFNIYKQSDINTMKINKNDKFVNFNNKKYFVGVNGVLYEVNYKKSLSHCAYLDQNYKKYFKEVYSSIDDNNEVFYIYIQDKEVIMKNYYDESIVYTYEFNPILAEYKYYKNTNFHFDWFNTGYEEAVDSYNIDDFSITLLEDNNLYFSYSRYLGEFEYSDCFHYDDCLFSRKGSEILRFNNETKKIEQVALVPESYSVLKIYLDRAYVMDNKGIACLYFKDNKFEYVYECDMKQYYNTKFYYGEENHDEDGIDINIKIYFENNEFKEFKNEIDYLSGKYYFGYNKGNIDYKR